MILKYAEYKIILLFLLTGKHREICTTTRLEKQELSFGTCPERVLSIMLK